MSCGVWLYDHRNLLVNKLKMLNGLSLFSGIGGIDVALSEWVRTVAYCEIEPFCQSVLLSRMSEGDLPKAPIWDDVRTLDVDRDLSFSEINPGIEIIFGGFPCQDISIAGAGKGLEGERSGLFFEILRLAKEIKPKFIFLENVPAITSRGGLRVVREVTEMGYDCRWCVISASGVGALHRRERWFLLAHSRCQHERSKKKSEWTPKNTSRRNRFWEIEPPVDRVVDGVQNRMDRLKALGNSVVTQQVKKSWEILTGIEYGRLLK